MEVAVEGVRASDTDVASLLDSVSSPSMALLFSAATLRRCFSMEKAMGRLSDDGVMGLVGRDKDAVDVADWLSDAEAPSLLEPVSSLSATLLMFSTHFLMCFSSVLGTENGIMQNLHL